MSLRPIESEPSKTETVNSSATKRHALGLARVLTIYGLLIGGAAIFSIPFIWMIGTSLKVDREMFGETITLLPQTPVPALQSPFLDGAYFSPPKSETSDRIRPWVIEHLQQATLPEEHVLLKNRNLADPLFPGIYRKLQDIVPSDVWKFPDDTLKPEVLARIDNTMITETFRAVYRPLTFSSLRVRSLDLQEKEMTTGAILSQLWTVSSEAPAVMHDTKEPTGPGGVLAYDFTGRRDSTVTLSTTLQLPFAAERLFRTQISITPDDSWHRIDFQFEKNGVLY